MVSMGFPSLKKVTNQFYLTGLRALKKLYFPSLESTAGCMQLSSFHRLEAIDLPKLTELQCMTINSNPELKTISMPSLVRMTNDFQISNDRKLQTLEFTRFRECRNFYVQMDRVEQLEKISFPALKTVNRFDLNLVHVKHLTTVSFPYIERAYSFTISYAEKLKKVYFPKLKTVKQTLRITYNRALESLEGLTKHLERVDQGLQIQNNNKLKALEFPALASPPRNLQMSNILSPELEILRLPLLKSINGGLYVNNGNFNLKVLDLPKLT